MQWCRIVKVMLEQVITTPFHFSRSDFHSFPFPSLSLIPVPNGNSIPIGNPISVVICSWNNCDTGRWWPHPAVSGPVLQVTRVVLSSVKQRPLERKLICFDVIWVCFVFLNQFVCHVPDVILCDIITCVITYDVCPVRALGHNVPLI